MATRKRSAEGEADRAKLAAEARLALARLVEAREGGTDSFDALLAALRVLNVALLSLEEDEIVSPSIRRMSAALQEATLAVLEDEIEQAARNIAICNPANVPRMVAAFLRAISPQLQGLGVAPHRIPRGVVPGILSRWRAKPNARAGELKARGVIVALLVAAGVEEKNARARVDRLAKSKSKRG